MLNVSSRPALPPPPARSATPSSQPRSIRRSVSPKKFQVANNSMITDFFAANASPNNSNSFNISTNTASTASNPVSHANPTGLASSTTTVTSTLSAPQSQSRNFVPLRPSTRVNNAIVLPTSQNARSEGMDDKNLITTKGLKRTRDGREIQPQPNGLTANAVTQTANNPTNGTNTSEPKRSRSPRLTRDDKSNVKTGTQTQPQKKAEETRSLRSKAGGSRLKSDLATYFPNFEDIIAGLPQEPEYLSVDESILITDEISHASPSQPAPRHSINLLRPSKPAFEPFDLSSLALPPRETQDITQSIDVQQPADNSQPVVSSQPNDASPSDPLDDSVFLPSHRRAERREKQLRNIEKERAQHEKGQLETLLDALQGPDWLRVMGITGITDGASKEYKPKRNYFISEVRFLLDKFKTWREMEKKLALEKQAREEEEYTDDEEDSEEEVGEADSTESITPSDVDAWAARQLLQEAKSASTKAPKAARRPKAQRQIIEVPEAPPEPPKPFTSFFSKPHLRAAALGKGRHGRRGVLAFGLPLPELEEYEFELGEDLLTADVIKANARKRRRMKREKNEPK